VLRKQAGDTRGLRNTGWNLC